MPFITCPAVWLLAKNTRLGFLLTLGPFIAVPLGKMQHYDKNCFLEVFILFINFVI
jgi:hypothetical protein